MRCRLTHADSAERGAVGRAQNGWFGQRVAQIALERRARQPEHRADDQAQQHAGQAQVEKDDAGDVVAATAKDSEDAGRRKRNGAEREGSQRGEQGRCDQRGEEERVVAGAHGLRLPPCLLQHLSRRSMLLQGSLWRHNLLRHDAGATGCAEE